MDSAAIRRQVDTSPLFAALPEDERAGLAARAEARRFDARQLLFHQGDPAEHVWQVASGQVRLSKLSAAGDQVIVAFVTPGNVFAVVAAMHEVRYPVTGEAVVASELLAWPRRVVGDVMARHPRLAAEAMAIVAARMHELQERFRELATLPVPQRLARELLRLAGGADAASEGRVALELRLTRQDLAELVGTTLFSVSRLLSEWAAEGIVEAGRARVAVLDLPRLRRLGEG